MLYGTSIAGGLLLMLAAVIGVRRIADQPL
jgi:hypothetical protein